MRATAWQRCLSRTSPMCATNDTVGIRRANIVNGGGRAILPAKTVGHGSYLCSGFGSRVAACRRLAVRA